MRNRVVFALFAMAAFAVVGFRQADQSTPQATVKAFAAAIEACDFKAAAKLVKGGKTDYDFSALEKNFKEMSLKIEIQDYKDDVKGDKATATYKLLVTRAGKPEPAEPDSVQLERVGGSWLLVPLATMDPKSPFGGLATMLSNPQIVVTQSRNAAATAACLSNLKQISTAFLMLSNDNDDVFKCKADGWKKTIMPYIKSEAIFHCTDDKSGGVSYSVNPNVLGKKSTAIQWPAETVLVYEGHNMKLDFRHAGKACVAYVDGHVKTVTPEQAKKLRWKP